VKNFVRHDDLHEVARDAIDGQATDSQEIVVHDVNHPDLELSRSPNLANLRVWPRNSLIGQTSRDRPDDYIIILNSTGHATGTSSDITALFYEPELLCSDESMRQNDFIMNNRIPQGRGLARAKRASRDSETVRTVTAARQPSMNDELSSNETTTIRVEARADAL
jgi:hypothetical protein